jgi:DNA damage-binding protein 1
MIHSKAIHGQISMLAKIRPEGAKTDHLFVGTRRFQYFTVLWNPNTRQLDTAQSFEDLSEKHMRDSQSRDMCFVDPSGRYLVMELFEGVLNLFKILKGRKGRGEYLSPAEQVRITELKVRATTFLYTDTKSPKIAFLYEEGAGNVRLSTYRIVDDKQRQFLTFDPAKERENDVGDLDLGASHLVPIPKSATNQRRHMGRNATTASAQLGGVIIVGETKMTYLDDDSKAIVEYTLDEANIWAAWERYDDLHYLLADIYGNLHLLTILAEDVEVMDMDVRKLGKTTIATVIVNLGDGVFYVGSHEGNAQVIRVNPNSETETMTLIQTMVNVAPILDFAVMDMGNREGETQTNEYSSGQARLVTGSGAFDGGSLRSVRSGVGLEDVGILADMDDVRAVFALHSSEESHRQDTVVVSFPTETRIFTFSPQGEIEEVESFRGLDLDHHTLLAMNLPHGLILQVTSDSVTILGPGPSYVFAKWQPQIPQIITAASANESHVLLAVNGDTIISLDVARGLEQAAAQPLEDGEQVACVHVPAHISGVGIVGFWKSGSISLLDLVHLNVMHSEDLRRKNDASIPRDIVMTQILHADISGPTLLVAMEDGIVFTFNVDRATYTLSGRKSIILGTQQARFSVLPRDGGLYNVFTTCEHPSLVYGSDGRIVYSAVTAEDAIYVCSFDSEAFPGSVILATSENLKISQIDTERRTHVRTCHMGQTVRRIAYSPNERVFGIGTIKRELIKGEELITSSFSLVEDVMFAAVGKAVVLKDERGPELIECVIRTELPSSYGDGKPVERFLVGTSFLESGGDDEDKNVKGRILVFGIDSKRTPYLVASQNLKCACRKIAMLDGKIVAALVKTVLVYGYLETTEKSAQFTKLATYRTSTCPIDLVVNGNIIAVADLMKSLSLVEYTPGEAGLPDRLEEVARHFQACWATSVAQIEDNVYLESDQEGNLLVLRRNPSGVTLEDKKRMQVECEMNLGEMVNKIQRINVEPSPNAVVLPKAFLATVSSCHVNF